MSKYIDADELYVDWYDSFVADDGTEYDNIPLITKGQIDDAPSIDIPTWIPCSKRLPDEGETVLVCFSPGHREMWDTSRVIEFGRINSDREELEGIGWEWLNESSCDYWEPVWDNQVAQVIAWMPLPPPYKEKNNE